MKAVAMTIVLGLMMSMAVIAGEPLIVAHRGLLRHAPENTLANFRACLELQIGFEFDVEKSRDGHLVCIHDSTVERTTDGQGRVSDLSLDMLRRLDAGNWFDPKFAGEKIPMVEEVLQLVASKQADALIAVDFKAEGVEEQVVRLAQKHDVLDRLLFIGRTITSSDVRSAITQAAKNANTAAVAHDGQEFKKALADPTANWVYFRFLPTEEQMEAVHAAGKKAFIAGTTVSGNVRENWKACQEAGIDAILTDFPLELRIVLREQSSR